MTVLGLLNMYQKIPCQYVSFPVLNLLSASFFSTLCAGSSGISGSGLGTKESTFLQMPMWHIAFNVCMVSSTSWPSRNDLKSLCARVSGLLDLRWLGTGSSCGWCGTWEKVAAGCSTERVNVPPAGPHSPGERARPARETCKSAAENATSRARLSAGRNKELLIEGFFSGHKKYL